MKAAQSVTRSPQSATSSRLCIALQQQQSFRLASALDGRTLGRDTTPLRTVCYSSQGDPQTTTDTTTSNSSSVSSPVASTSSRGLMQQATEGSEKVNWVSFLGTLAIFGALNGTLLDGIHSRTGLQVYDVLPVTLGGLVTSALVPPLLAVFYIALGTLTPLADNLVGGAKDPATARALNRSKDMEWVALCFGVLAAELQLSAWLFSTGKPPSEIFLALAAASAASWLALDGTKQGLALATICALGAPAAELVLLHFFPLWHYPSGDILGGAFVSWVPWCYFFYTPTLSALGRYLWYTATHLPPGDNTSN